MLEIIHQFYPGARPGNSFIKSIYQILETEYSLLPHQILLAHSICSDDINSIEYPEEGRKMLGPFNLGGLNGIPFTGLTGMGAFAHHVPDDGAALIFFAPHIGIGASGVPGQVLRVGQDHPSNCCGALVKGLQSLKAGSINQGEPDLLDYQQQTLEKFLLKETDRITAAANQIVEGTEVIYKASEQLIEKLILNTSFTGKYIFVVGAIIINSDRDYGSYLELRKLHCYDVQTKQLINAHTFTDAASQPINTPM